jgi:hypothetical protein
MISRRPSSAPRDQDASRFSGILGRFCDASGALAVALVDAEGETVDYAGRLEPFDIKVAAAEWRLILSLLQVSRVPHWSETQQLLARGRHRSFVVVALSEGYALVVLLPRHAFEVSELALSELVREINGEADLSPAARPSSRPEERWTQVEVRTSKADPRRPLAVWHNGAWRAVAVLGRYVRASRDPGYRARLASGAEITLVREPLGKWYAQDL